MDTATAAATAEENPCKHDGELAIHGYYNSAVCRKCTWYQGFDVDFFLPLESQMPHLKQVCNDIAKYHTDKNTEKELRRLSELEIFTYSELVFVLTTQHQAKQETTAVRILQKQVHDQAKKIAELEEAFSKLQEAFSKLNKE